MKNESQNLDERTMIREQERMAKAAKRKKRRKWRILAWVLVIVLVVTGIWYVGWGRKLLTANTASTTVKIEKSTGQTVVYARIDEINGNEITYTIADEVKTEEVSDSSEGAAEPDGAADGKEDAAADSQTTQGTEGMQMPQQGEMPDMGSMPSGGNMPDMGNMPSGGNMPDMSSMPSGGNMPDMSNMPSGGNMPDMSNMPGGSESQNAENSAENTSFRGQGGRSQENREGSGLNSEMPDVSNLSSGGSMPDMSNMPSGEMPDMSSMPNSGNMPDMSSMQNGGSMPDMSSMQNGEMPDMNNMQGGFGGRGSMSGTTMSGSTDTGMIVYDGTTYRVGTETVTKYIPVGTDVTTKLGTVTTFSRLAAGDYVALVTEKDGDEEVIVAVYIIG